MKQALEYDAGGPWQQSAERIDGVGVALLVRGGKGVLWIVALFYAYGTLVQLSLTGFAWLVAPRKWQALDILYLILDLAVAVGFFAGWRAPIFAFYLAATSQILLYTFSRHRF